MVGREASKIKDEEQIIGSSSLLRWKIFTGYGGRILRSSLVVECFYGNTLKQGSLMAHSISSILWWRLFMIMVETFYGFGGSFLR